MSITNLNGELCIFIPSHIRYDNQINFLDRCLKSLINQKNVTFDIYLSISFKNYKFKLDFDNYYKYINYPNLNINIHNERLYQIEHLKYLSNKFAHKYKYIMFCDDDDTYNEYRVIIMYTMLLQGLNINPNIYAITDVNNIALREYWQYLIKSEVIIKFFEKTNKFNHLLKNKVADTYLAMYLHAYNDNSGTYILYTKQLYNYDITNINSVCHKINSTVNTNLKSIRGLIIYYLMRKFYRSISEVAKKNNLTKKQIDMLVPEKKQIIELTKILYNNHSELLNDDVDIEFNEKYVDNCKLHS